MFQAVSNPAYVTWFHNSNLVLDLVDTNLQHSLHSTSSTLSLYRVTKSASGNYTCHPANLHKTWVTLHVLDSGDSGESMPVVESDSDRLGPAAGTILTLLITLYNTSPRQ